MDQVVILGTRGSVPVDGAAFSRYGGATTCVLARLGGQYVVLDAGTGLMRLPPEAAAARELPVLLTHFHLDHLLGLPLCPYLFSNADGRMTVYAGEHEGVDAAYALNVLFAPPLWPVSVTGRLTFRTLEPDFSIGPVRVETMAGVHPNGISLLRLSAGGKRVVFATDFTLTDALAPSVAEFARGCDLLLCDGQYSDAEFAERASFGHNSWRIAAELASRCGAKQFRVLHHDPFHDDAVLDRADVEIRRVCPTGGAARQGEEITL